MGVPIQKENEAPLDPDAKGGKWGGNIPSSPASGRASCALSTGSRVEPRPKMILLEFSLRTSPFLTAGDSKFFTFLSWKVRDTVPLSPKSGGTGTPRKLRLCLWPVLAVIITVIQLNYYYSYVTRHVGPSDQQHKASVAKSTETLRRDEQLAEYSCDWQHQCSAVASCQHQCSVLWHRLSMFRHSSVIISVTYYFVYGWQPTLTSILMTYIHTHAVTLDTV